MKKCLTCGALGDTTRCATCVNRERDYKRVHQAIAVTRGSASRLRCSCGAVAAQWAYNNSCQYERVDGRGRWYCVHPSHYDAMCVPCHRDMDAQRRLSLL